MNDQTTASAIPCAGLAMSQVARFSHLVREHLGAHWSIQPWLGRLNVRVVVVGHGPQAERALAAASVALIRIIMIPEHAGDAEFRLAIDQIRRALRDAELLPNPYQEAANQGLTSAMARSNLDLRARQNGAAWRHPDLGLVMANPRQGWVASDQRCPEVVGAGASAEWIEQLDLPDQRPAHVCSMEQWIFQTQLRWRHGAPQYPADLVVQLTGFPDISGVTGQPRILQALLALQEGHSLLEAHRQSGCPLRVIDALVSALALSGLIADFHRQTDAATSPPNPAAEAPRKAPVTNQLHGLRRIAHYLGISLALGS